MAVENRIIDFYCFRLGLSSKHLFWNLGFPFIFRFSIEIRGTEASRSPKFNQIIRWTREFRPRFGNCRPLRWIYLGEENGGSILFCCQRVSSLKFEFLVSLSLSQLIVSYAK